MVTLSGLYSRRCAWGGGGNSGLTCSLPGQRRQAEPELPLTWGRYPGPCFSGTSPFRSASRLRREGGAAAAAGQGWTGRLPLPRPRRRRSGGLRGRHDAAGDVEVAEGISAGLKGFEAGPCPAAQAGGARPGRVPQATPEGGGSSRVLARPRGGNRGPPPAGCPSPLPPPQPVAPGPRGRALGAGCPVNMYTVKCTARAGRGGEERAGRGAGGCPTAGISAVRVHA